MDGFLLLPIYETKENSFMGLKNYFHYSWNSVTSGSGIAGCNCTYIQIPPILQGFISSGSLRSRCPKSGQCYSTPSAFSFLFSFFFSFFFGQRLRREPEEMGGWMDGCTYVQTYRFPLYSAGLRPPLGTAALLA